MGNQDFLEQAALEDEARAPSAVPLKELSEAVHGLVNIQTSIERTETMLTALKRQEENLVRNVIPGLLKQHHVASIEIEGGKKVSLEDKVYIRIPSPKETTTQTEEEKEAAREARKEAIAFLFDHGGGSLVKEQTIVEEADGEIKKMLTELGFNYEDKIDVNTNSLVAWTKDVLGIKKGSVQRIRPEEFPKAMGLFQYTEAKVK